jgi:hypothetical protein
VTEQSAQGFFIWAASIRHQPKPEVNNEFMATEAIMEIEGLEIVRLELKYCERCGGLWMRVWGTEDVYCPSCAPQMSDLPAVRRRRKPHLLVNDRVEIKSQCEELSAFFGEGGNA